MNLTKDGIYHRPVHISSFFIVCYIEHRQVKVSMEIVREWYKKLLSQDCNILWDVSDGHYLRKTIVSLDVLSTTAKDTYH